MTSSRGWPRSTRAAQRSRTGASSPIEPIEVSELLVRYAVPLDAGRRLALSEVEPPSSLYVPAERRSTTTSRAAAARRRRRSPELAIALFPSLEPGGPASGFRDVLTAESHAAAADVLDELSYPRLASDGGPGVVDEPLGDLGADEAEGDSTLRPRPHVGEADGDKQGGSEPGAYQPEPGAGDDAAGQQAAGEQSEGEPPARPADGTKRQRQRQSRLRTYVAPRGGEAGQRSAESEDEATARRTEIEEAGIARVVAAEVRAGWATEVMPPFNPGFDIRSTSLTGDVRLIEVKSTAVEWGALWASGVSHRQFLTSLEEGDRFWLYVVERADDDDHFQIFRIYEPRTAGRPVHVRRRVAGGPRALPGGGMQAGRCAAHRAMSEAASMTAPVLEGQALNAVLHRGLHLQIIAAAGSGKTEVVSQRVASLARRRASPPRSIVAFTFTERAAAGAARPDRASASAERLGRAVARPARRPVRRHDPRLLLPAAPAARRRATRPTTSSTTTSSPRSCRARPQRLEIRQLDAKQNRAVRRDRRLPQERRRRRERAPRSGGDAGAVRRSVLASYYDTLDRYRLLTYGQQIVRAVRGAREAVRARRRGPRGRFAT